MPPTPGGAADRANRRPGGSRDRPCRCRRGRRDGATVHSLCSRGPTAAAHPRARRSGGRPDLGAIWACALAARHPTRTPGVLHRRSAANTRWRDRGGSQRQRCRARGVRPLQRRCWRPNSKNFIYTHPRRRKKAAGRMRMPIMTILPTNMGMVRERRATIIRAASSVQTLKQHANRRRLIHFTQDQTFNSLYARPDRCGSTLSASGQTRLRPRRYKTAVETH